MKTYLRSLISERKATKIAWLELLPFFQQVWNGSTDRLEFETERGVKGHIERRGGTGRQIVIVIQDMEYVRAQD